MTAPISAIRTSSAFLRFGLLATVLAAGTASTEGASSWERQDGPFYSRGVVWSATDLTERNLRSFYGQLSQELKANRAWVVEVFVDQEDAARELHGKLRTELDYEWWLNLYEHFGRKLLPMAEILSYQRNAVLRLRDDSGTCSEVVLSGENFLRIRIDRNQFEILETYFSPLPPIASPSRGDESMISVFVRASSPPTIDQARRFSVLMRKRFQQRRIMVVFRTDSYFITADVFPIVYRFDQYGSPPSREQYAKSKTIYCFCDQPGIPCH